jgi:hypothetical protein
MFLEYFWPDDVELATNQEVYNNQDLIDDISTDYSSRPEDILWREQPVEQEDRNREEEWREFFSKSETTAKPEETKTDEVFLCIKKIIDNQTDTDLELVELESQKMEAEEQKMNNWLEVLRIKHQIKVVEKAKEQAKLQEQTPKSTT